MNTATESDLNYLVSGDAWKDYPKAVCAVFTSDFDKLAEGSYYYVIKDSPFDLTCLKAKRRYEITKGSRYFHVSKIDCPSDYVEELYDVYLNAMSGYGTQKIETMSRSNFANWLKSMGLENKRGGKFILCYQRIHLA